GGAQLARGPGRARGRAGGGGEGAHREKGLPRLYPLEASRDGGDGADGARDERGLHAEGDAHTRGGEEVLHVVLAHQRRGEIEGAGGGAPHYPDGPRARGPARGADIRPAPPPAGPGGGGGDR